jgi:RNA polymerase sigma-70 factor, ECF subfamily
MQDDDSDVVDALSRRDVRRALTLLMDRYGDAVYRFAFEMTRDEGLADEVRQQVFVEAFRDLERFEGRSAVRSWLFGIARHRALDASKARRRWWQRFKGDSGDESGGGGADDAELAPGPDRDLERSRIAAVLAGCLEKLAPAAREAVVLRYQLELSYDEVAAVTGDRVGTLQQRVARALPVLRKCVEARMSSPRVVPDEVRVVAATVVAEEGSS